MMLLILILVFAIRMVLKSKKTDEEATIDEVIDRK